MWNSRAARLAYQGLPLSFCLAVHYIALKTWFANDDFAWLGLRQMIESPHDLLTALFTPMAQGTVRVLSERLYFLVFTSLFGLHALPFKIWVFITQFANICLLAWIARRLTGSRLAGFLAPIFWTANCGLAIALSWSSAYDEILFAFFLLLSFWLFLKYIDTRQPKYWIAQWLSFILGFGALELIVMYPALAAGYAFLCARKYFRRTLPLFIPSILFTAWHFIFIPRPADPSYAMRFDWGMLRTAWNYWTRAIAASRPDLVDWRPLWLGRAVAVAITALLLVFVLRTSYRRNWLPLFLLLWFFIAILPVLPLQNHFTDYYLTVPSIGFAMLLAMTIASALRPLRLLAVIAGCFYLLVSISDIHGADTFLYRRARNMHYLMDGLVAARKANPMPIVILSGVDNGFFWSGFLDDPFRLIGLDQVYLVPGSERAIDPHPEWGGISRFVLSLENAVRDLKQKRAEVFALEDRKLRNVTAVFRPYLYQRFISEHPSFVDAGDPAYQNRLGDTWYPAENGFRWMPQTAMVTLPGPKSDGESLYITGYCPAAVVARGPVEVTFRAGGANLGSATLNNPNSPFQLSYPLPKGLQEKPELELSISVNRTIESPGDRRPLGLVFGTFDIK